MKRLWILLFTTLILTSCLDKLANSMLYQYDEANKVEVSSEPPAPLQMIDVTSAGGSRTVGWYYENSKKNAPVLLYFHGNASNIQAQYDSGFVNKVMAMNVHVAVFDYPKYGLSTGEVNQKGVLQASQAVIEFLKNKFPNSKFIFWGRSLGSAPATISAEKNSNIVSKLILTSPWDSFWKLAKFKSGLPDSACKNAAKGNEYLSEESAKNIYIPVLIHHGTDDQTVPWSLGKNLSDSFASNDVTFISVEAAGHNNLLGDKEWSEIQAFVRY